MPVNLGVVINLRSELKTQCKKWRVLSLLIKDTILYGDISLRIARLALSEYDCECRVAALFQNISNMQM